jgi:hypothetical protein
VVETLFTLLHGDREHSAAYILVDGIVRVMSEFGEAACEAHDGVHPEYLARHLLLSLIEAQDEST